MFRKRAAGDFGDPVIFDSAVADVLPYLEATPMHSLYPPLESQKFCCGSHDNLTRPLPEEQALKQDLVFKCTICDDRTHNLARFDLSNGRQPVVARERGGSGTGGRHVETARGEHYGGF